jgi:hypothetical protein
LAKGENGDMLAGFYNILNRWKNYFSQLLNVQRISDVRHMEIHAAELLIPEPSTFEVKIATAKLKRYKTPDIDQISAELIQAGARKLCSKIYKLINAIILPIYKKCGEN